MQGIQTAGKPMSQQAGDITENIKTTSPEGWSKDYFENFSTWQGEPLERPEQLPLEKRLPLNEFSENT